MTEIPLHKFSGLLKIEEGLVLQQKGATITVSLPESNKHEAEFLERATKVYRNFHGCSTPAEEFILNIIRIQAEDDSGITPDNIADDLETFRDNFDDSIRDARRMLKRYPNLFRDDDAPKAA